MQKEFWIDKWNQKQIGFHQSATNSYLQRFWHETGAGEGGGVFVPLCGKTKDMLWLQEQGHRVTGVEFSPVAVAEFFDENEMQPAVSKHGAFDISEAGSFRIFCGDFFDLSRDDMAGVKAVYDRAALIALPPDVRRKYAQHLTEILPKGCALLLVTLEYPQETMEGPPFSVAEAEVKALFSEAASLRFLERKEIEAQNPRLRDGGVEKLHECSHLIVFT